MPFKFSMLMNVPAGGFSETWYYDGGTDLPVPPGNPFDDLALARQSILSKNAVMIGWRLTDMANPRVSEIKLYPKGVVNDSAADVPTTAWLAIAKGANNIGRRQLWIRGVADDMVSWNEVGQRFQYNAAFLAAFNEYVRTLTGAGSKWSIQHVGSKKELGAAVFPVSAVAPVVGSSGTSLTCPNAVNNALPIIVAGFKKPLGKLNGTYLPTSGFLSTVNTVALLTKSAPTYALNGYPGGATVRQRLTTLVNVKNIKLEFARERRVGRAFFELRGRR